MGRIACIDRIDRLGILYPVLCLQACMRRVMVLVLASLIASPVCLGAQRMPKRSRADTLRGSFTTPGRAWWEVSFYDLHVAIRPNDTTIAGRRGTLIFPIEGSLSG